MQNAVIFVVRTLFDLYVLTFILRLLLLWGRTDSWNPLVQFIVRVTDPLVLPLKRILPTVGRIDTATLVALIALELGGIMILVELACVGTPGIAQIFALTGLAIVHMVLRTWFWAILIYVILSWVSPGGYNPAAAVLTTLVEPVLQPFRRLLPQIGGLDLSPLFAMLILQAVIMILPMDRLLSGMLCLGYLGPII